MADEYISIEEEAAAAKFNAELSATRASNKPVETVKKPDWETPQVHQTEIGEMKGREKGEKITVLEYLGWVLKEPFLKTLAALDEPNEIPLPIGPSPREIVDAKKENQRFDERREWQKLFDQHYPEPTAEEINAMEFNDIILGTGLGNGPWDVEADIDFLKSKLVDKDGKPKCNILVIDTPEVGSPIENQPGKTHNFETTSEFRHQLIKEKEASGELRPGKKTILGHSKGGFEAVFEAVNHPDEVDNIICISTPLKPSDREPAPWLIPLLKTIDALPVNKILDFVSDKFHIPKEKFHSMLRKATPKEMIKTYLDIPAHNWEEVLAKIPKEIGTVFTKGREDGALDSMGYEASLVVPEATRIGFPDLGHGRPSSDILFRILVGEQKKLNEARASQRTIVNA